MSKLLEIFGKGITVNTADVMIQWLIQSLNGQEISEKTDLLKCITDHLVNRELVHAEKGLRDYLNQYPDCILGRMASAAACLIQNDLKEAVCQVQSVYYRQPANTMALYVMGYCHERLGHIDQAIEFYQDCVKFKSYLKLPRQRMAAIYLKQGRLDLAIREYEILTTEHPDCISSITLLGYLYLASHQPKQAADTFNLAILSHPDNFIDLKEDDEIETLLRNEMYEQALDRVKEVIEMVGPMPHLIIRMGDIYSQWEKNTEAVACYEHAIRIESDSLESLIKLGTHHLRNQQFLLAAEQFNHASETNDEILDAYIGLATAQYMSGQPKEAVKTLRLAVSIHKNSTLLFSEAAILHFQSLMDEESSFDLKSDKDIVTIDHVVAVYEEMLKQKENEPDVFYEYGMVMSGQDQSDKAVNAFGRAYDLNPANYRARAKLSLSILEDDEKAALDVIKEDPLTGASCWERYYQAAMIHADKKALKKAMNKINSASSVGYSGVSSVQARLENIFEVVGVIDRSLMSWERINEASGCLTKIFEQKHVHDLF